VLHAAFFHLHVTREKLPKRLTDEKEERKMLMKLTPGVSFINILLEHFAPIFLCQKLQS